MASILVTGGAGFIGSNLCRTLLSEGHTVYAVDNFITGSRENLAGLYAFPHFYFAEVDITHPDFLRLFDGIPVDRIYHLACPTGVPNIRSLGSEMLAACSFGTFNVLEIARRYRAKLLFASTAEVYGEPQMSPQREDYTGNVSTLGPRSAYEEGKRFSEACIANAVTQHGMTARIVRIFNTYGPGMSLQDFRVIPQFIQSIRDGRPLRIYGDGSQTRTHLYVDDLIRGIELVMERGASGEAYNIGSSRPMSVRQLAEMLIDITGHREGIAYEPHFIEDHTHRLPATQKVSALGWNQRVDIRDGLERMAAHYLPVAPPDPVAPKKTPAYV